MKIKIIAIGRLKEKSYTQIMDEFTKRIRPYCTFEVVEITPETTKTSPNDSTIRQKEAEKILAQIAQSAFVITLQIDGKALSSEAFATQIREITNLGTSELVFVIGGSVGLGEAVKERSNLAISFSKMTFTHQFARLMLVEQIYRAFKILNNETYHK